MQAQHIIGVIHATVPEDKEEASYNPTTVKEQLDEANLTADPGNWEEGSAAIVFDQLLTGEDTIPLSDYAHRFSDFLNSPALKGLKVEGKICITYTGHHPEVYEIGVRRGWSYFRTLYTHHGSKKQPLHGLNH